MEGLQQGWRTQSEWRWQIRSERASPRFTTRWDKLVKAESMEEAQAKCLEAR
ncbi:MAG: DUF4113 domain-containing protein [Nodosilinea sp. WJT8-NPBG4]|nr:DUF4113 domain-containing protein [Nodosilinea sp. WJT8-NPBG4]